MGTTTSGNSFRATLRDVARWHPFLTLLVWLAIVVAIAGAAQLGAVIFGSSWRVLSSEGHEVLFIASIFGWLSIASADVRPLDTFGLAPGARWPVQLGVGFAVGMILVGVFWFIAVRGGGYVALDDASVARGIAIIWILPTAIVTSYLVQIATSGYVLGMVRSRLGWLPGIIIAGVVFALIQRAGYALFDEPTDQRKLIGFTLLGTTLAAIRLWSGSIVAPGAVLAGFFAANKLNHETGLARGIGDMEIAGVIAPYRDMLESKFVWMTLGGALLVFVVVFLIRGVPQPRTDARIARSLKRFYPLGMASCLAPIDVWFGRLCDAGWRVAPVYWLRLAAVLGCSLFATVLTFPERLLGGMIARGRPRPAPVFVLGVHRSGTTHLQNLLALDPNLAPARTCHVMNPHGFISLGWLLMPAVAAFMPWRRPMDRVRYGLFSPNEEEFALMNMTGLSPHWGMTFPRRWPEYDRAIDPRTLDETERCAWERAYVTFVDKLVLFSRRRPLLKNPYNTARMGLLRRLFPDARFIHICRDPYTVVQSNIHLADEGHVLMQLQDPVPGRDYGTRFLDNYRMMEDTYVRDRAEADDEAVTDIRFEDLEADPIGVVRAAYAALGLEWTTGFEARLHEYVAGQSSYRKNRHRSLPDDLREAVEATMGEYVERWGYGKPAEGRSGEACATPAPA